MLENSIYLPIGKLLKNPLLFCLISQTLDVPATAVSEGFYDLVDESVSRGLSLEGLSMFATEAGSQDIVIILENRMAIRMEKREEGVFHSSKEMETSFEVNSWISQVLKKHLPLDWRDDFGLVEIPLPKNNFLLNEADKFEGEVYRLSSPNQKKKFTLTVIGDDYDVKLG